MIPENYTSIINNIVEKTKAGKANWRETSDPDTVLLSFSEYSFMLCKSEPNQWTRMMTMAGTPTTTIEFRLISNEGKIVDSFELRQRDEHWELMNNLYEMARRKAMGVDNILKKLEKDLDTSGEIGQAKPEAPPSMGDK